ncbi:alpha/beta fold hydrolase [Nonomuraea sp. NPDC004186]
MPGRTFRTSAFPLSRCLRHPSSGGGHPSPYGRPATSGDRQGLIRSSVRRRPKRFRRYRSVLAGGELSGMMVNQDRITDSLLDEWWAPMTFRDNIRATYLLERRLDWAQTERALPSTNTPTLVLWGRQDTIQPVERAHRFAELLPHDQLHILDGCGHAPQLDCPGPVNRHLQTFFTN